MKACLLYDSLESTGEMEALLDIDTNLFLSRFTQMLKGNNIVIHMKKVYNNAIKWEVKYKRI